MAKHQRVTIYEALMDARIAYNANPTPANLRAFKKAEAANEAQIKRDQEEHERRAPAIRFDQIGNPVIDQGGPKFTGDRAAAIAALRAEAAKMPRYTIAR